MVAPARRRSTLDDYLAARGRSRRRSRSCARRHPNLSTRHRRLSSRQPARASKRRAIASASRLGVRDLVAVDLARRPSVEASHAARARRYPLLDSRSRTRDDHRSPPRRGGILDGAQRGSRRARARGAVRADRDRRGRAVRARALSRRGRRGEMLVGAVITRSQERARRIRSPITPRASRLRARPAHSSDRFARSADRVSRSVDRTARSHDASCVRSITPRARTVASRAPAITPRVRPFPPRARPIAPPITLAHKPNRPPRSRSVSASPKSPAPPPGHPRCPPARRPVSRRPPVGLWVTNNPRRSAASDSSDAPQLARHALLHEARAGNRIVDRRNCHEQSQPKKGKGDAP